MNGKQLMAALVAVMVPLAASAAGKIEEVVVTATKRDTSLQDIAGAASVIGGDSVGAGGVQTVRDLNIDVPNLSIGDQFGFARIFMRGIGMTSIDIGGEGAVAFLQDGAIIPRPAAQLVGMFDLQQVEVLRGPQGTLYGRGATAGAINLVTRKPGTEFGGYARLTAGNYDSRNLEAAVDLPMTDTLALRLATKIDRRNGYGDNLFTGNDVDDRKAEAYRGTLAFTPGGIWDATLSYQYWKEDDNNYAFHYFGPSAGTVGGVPPAVPVLGGQTILDVGGSKHDLYSDQKPINDRDGYLANLIVNVQLADNLTLRSVSSSQTMERFLRDDLDSTQVNLFGQNNYTENSHSLGQEFTLDYTADRYSVLAGAMYFNEDLFGQVKVPLTNVCFLIAPALCGTPTGDALNAGNYLQNGDVKIDAWAAYAEGHFDVTDRFTMIAGVRYNYEQRDGSGSFIFDALGVNVPTNAVEDWDDVTWRLTAQYDLTQDMQAYATLSKAFKSGVINTGSTSPPLDPETVNAFEAGVKGTTADGILRYSLTGFYYDYQNLQISFVDASSTVSTVNAAKAENYGLELELDGTLDNGFGADFFATWLNAEYKKFVNGDYANGFAITDLSGNTLPNAPQYSAKLGLTWQGEVQGGLLRVRGEGYWQDDVYFTEWNRPDAEQKAYGVINASVDYAFGPDQRWQVSAWGRNLGDKDVISNNIITAPLYNSLRVGSMLPPRTYGLTVGVDF